MQVLLVSECSKAALVGTRRILDQFAERKGERTWQTSITMLGLETLRKMLRKSAKRNTAVACHWIKSGGRTDLLWIVGSASRFNDRGVVPTNTTRRDILRSNRENEWRTMGDIALTTALAGLFHDFGKANSLFQKKLSVARPMHEPFRHEWVSLKMFQAFVENLNDREWLEKLSQVTSEDETPLIAKVKEMQEMDPQGNPFPLLPPLARTVGWLILSHHRLPVYFKAGKHPPKIKFVDSWLDHELDALWNSPAFKYKAPPWSEAEKSEVWNFKGGSPLVSRTWREQARKMARRCLNSPSLCSSRWLSSDKLSLHLSRMILMLSDHYYSAGEPKSIWQDPAFSQFANSDRKTGAKKQKLDEHCIGVSRNAYRIANRFPSLPSDLPALSRHKGFKTRSLNSRFRWQDRAYDLSCGLRKRAKENGFFGVNMASTGCGKTFGNARIMYGLSDERLGFRVSIALGLRTLTLQTGDALRERLQLGEDDLAVLIGSQPMRDLHEHNREARDDRLRDPAAVHGSMSADDFLGFDTYVRYDGECSDGVLRHWLEKDPILNKLVSAPVLVSTIDHLISATESARGGGQIAPMLRLVTADLVLDEPDDFGLEDLPALTRLVNWAGMLGSKVLISSATLPPALVHALFDSYRAGRAEFQTKWGDNSANPAICCAWYDENFCANSDHETLGDYIQAHKKFTEARVAKIADSEPVRRGLLIPVTLPRDKSVSKDLRSKQAIRAISNQVQQGMYDLHDLHAQRDPTSGKLVSFGLVRMANIKPLVAVAKSLLVTTPKSDLRIHVCVYHSQHPFSVRSKIEEVLDQVLDRRDPVRIWSVQAVQSALQKHGEQNQIFVVLATPVAEVGRDHDYDWAIVEPSSMRSIIQIAGRVQRHRNQSCSNPNLYVLSRNFRSLRGEGVAFIEPGFESEAIRLRTHDLQQVLDQNQISVINSIPRILEEEGGDFTTNLVKLEHHRLRTYLFGESGLNASVWWNHNATWSWEIQRLLPFRQSAPRCRYVLHCDDNLAAPTFQKIDDDGGLKEAARDFHREDLQIDPSVSTWGYEPIEEITANLAEERGMDLAECSRRFNQIELRDKSGGHTPEPWCYEPVLGVYEPGL